MFYETNGVYSTERSGLCDAMIERITCPGWRPSESLPKDCDYRYLDPNPRPRPVRFAEVYTAMCTECGTVFTETRVVGANKRVYCSDECVRVGRLRRQRERYRLHGR